MASFAQLEHSQKRLNAPSAMSEPVHDSVVEELKKGQSNILVAVRLRPMLMKEVEQGQFNLIKMLDDKVVILQDPQDLSEQYTSELRKKRTRQKQYAFDFAFDQDAQQEKVFNLTTQFLIEGILNGYNSTVFAYGATGAGKTFTMLGNQVNPGIMYQTMKEIFEQLQDLKIDREYEIKVSFLEIYNENIRDLIEANNEVRPEEDNYLDLREDP